MKNKNHFVSARFCSSSGRVQRMENFRVLRGSLRPGVETGRRIAHHTHTPRPVLRSRPPTHPIEFSEKPRARSSFPRGAAERDRTPGSRSQRNAARGGTQGGRRERATAAGGSILHLAALCTRFHQGSSLCLIRSRGNLGSIKEG